MAAKRTPKNEAIIRDLTEPLDITTVVVDPNECFGQAWDPRTDECKLCADSVVCSIVKKKGVVAKAAKQEEAEGPYLDMARMNKVTDAEIEDWLDHNDKPELDMMLDALLAMGRTQDEQSAIERLQRFKAGGTIRIAKDEQGVARVTRLK